MNEIDWQDLPDRDGFTLRVAMLCDYESKPQDADCYTTRQIGAWLQNQWQYVTLIVTASREGVELGSAALSGIEEGNFTVTDDDDNVTEVRYLSPLSDGDYVANLTDEAITEARGKLAALCGEQS